MQDYSVEVRRNAVNALYSIGKDVIPQAFDYLTNTGSATVKTCIFQLLVMLQAKEAIPRIESVLAAEADSEVLKFGRQVLGILKGTIIDRKIPFF